jgi:HlyD family secretion protein
MRFGKNANPRDAGGSDWDRHERSDGLGPQGAALILELQRLRRALDSEALNDRRETAPRHNAKPGRRHRPVKAKRPRKSRVGRAIGICLEQFGLKPAAQPAARSTAQVRTPASPPRRESPTLAPRDPLTMDLSIPTLELPEIGSLDQLLRIESPGLALSHRLEPQTAAGRLIERCRSGLMTGIAFVARSDAPPNEAAGSLMLRTRWAFEHELRVGLRILIVATVLGGGWFVFMPLAGAVVVPGNVVVQSNVKQIQHPTGGVIGEIKVHNGTLVHAGDLLVRLDATQTKASLQVVTKQLDEIRARIARLVAERDGLSQISVPAELAAKSNDEMVKSLLASEDSLFKARSSARQSQIDLLHSQIAQLTQEISGLEAQVDSKAKQLDLIQGELSGVQELYDKRLVPLTRLTSLQREAARIDGERGQLMSSIAATKSKIDASRLQIVRIDQDFRTEVVKDLNDAQGKEAELVERSVAARDLLDRIEIRAPTTGAVNQLSVHTIGGVIKAGETIMEIVPDADDLQIEAHVQPKDIDHVKMGQTAFVRLTAFNQRTTPQLNGTVSYVSADTGHDQQTNAPSYTVRVLLPEEERRRLNGQQLVPGMPAEVFVQTGSRSMMSYVFEPITDQLRRAFVEQ